MFDLIYHCDSYPAIGNGHLSRGIMVLNKLLEQDPSLKIAMHGKFSDSAERFKKQFLNKSVLEIDDIQNVQSNLAIIDTMFDPIDESYIDGDFCRKFKENSGKLALLQSVLGEIKVPDSVDFIINHMPDLNIQSERQCSLYVGFDYVPVTDDFINYSENNGKNLLIILGSNKEQTAPEKLLSSLCALGLNQFSVEMILSPHYPEKDLENLRNKFQKMDLSIYQNVPSLLPYFRKAFALICTYGHTTYEALTYHLPTFLVAYKPFQNQYADYLEEKDLAVNLGFFEKLDSKKLLLLESEKLKESLVQNSKIIFNKCGIDNITNVLLSEMDDVSI